jgi:hypothetical protein
MMDGPNQFFISRILGSTMKHIKGPEFGPLGALHAQHQVLANRPKHGEQITFTPPTDKIIARAFEEIRQGLAVDRVLADPDLARKFFCRCQQLGVTAPAAAINRRLFRFRKSPGRFIRIQPATVTEPKRDFSPYLFAADMAIAQIRYRFGASVDDILADPEIGMEFDRLVEKLHPGWSALEYRLAALHVRKSRYFKPDEIPLFEAIKKVRTDNLAEDRGTLDKLDIQELSRSDAIIGLVEKARSSRFLYIAQAKSVQETVAPFLKQSVFEALANFFWSPSLSSIYLIVYDIHGQYHKASQSLWTKRLIRDKSPIFNWPVHDAA